METSPVLLVVGFALSFFMAWSLGANDAATPCSTPVGARVISTRRATILFAIFTTFGAIAQGYMNIKTISSGIVPRIDPIGAVAISLAACVWSTYCTWKGLEISNTYTVVGSVMGYAMIVYRSFNSEVLAGILGSWVVSPFFSITMAYLLHRIMRKLFNRFLDNAKFLRIITISLTFALCFSAYSFGANDVGNATGVYVAVTQEVMGLPDFTTTLILAAFGAIGIAVGGLTWGYRVIETVAFKIVRLDALSALAAEVTNGLVVYLFVTIPYLYFGYGLPVSTSIVGIGAIIGAGMVGGRSMVDRKVVWRLVITWVLTIPVVAMISATLYVVLSQLIHLSGVMP